MAMHAYAQTNIQLLNQLRAGGYATAELARIRDVYEFAMLLFTGRYQPCGKPFIDHLVGTVSILASSAVAMKIEAAKRGVLWSLHRMGRMPYLDSPFPDLAKA
jgi:(p)ppGpp synthase/HD superfamily hydrolase